MEIKLLLRNWTWTAIDIYENKQKPSYWKDHLLSSQVKVPLESGLWDNDYYKKAVEGRNSRTVLCSNGQFTSRKWKLKVFFLLGRKAITNLESILKSRDITLPAKIHLVKAMIFPVVLCGCKSWTIKKAEHQRIDAFELWYWRRLLRVPWTTRRSNQSMLKEISPEYSLEGLMLKLKLQYFGHLIWRADSLEKTLILGKIEGRRRR